MFAKNLAFAVFGYNTFKGSSVTGAKCNAKQNATPKTSLDSTKLMAIKDMYHHYLMRNLHYPEEAADLELVQATSYIASKISDMNRLLKAKKRERKFRQASLEDEVDELQN
ncbi:uncharacterized protein LOC105193783 [Solenopsis invicta]|uniref:uncharacterized protein LOC105193783 n=1 Tax=Solenopsis invicta TaxID=13686 RepID=UPI000595BAE5|nr:uncharacterized protein LOC105193783 [Solenopsis invicta]